MLAVRPTIRVGDDGDTHHHGAGPALPVPSISRGGIGSGSGARVRSGRAPVRCGSRFTTEVNQTAHTTGPHSWAHDGNLRPARRHPGIAGWPSSKSGT